MPDIAVDVLAGLIAAGLTAIIAIAYRRYRKARGTFG